MFATPAVAVQADQASVVNAVPAAFTPNVNDGVVYAIGRVGSNVYIGGSFTNLSPHKSSTIVNQPYLAAFDAATGDLVSSFAPVLDGQVETILPGPTPGTVYAAGAFKNVNGVKTRLVLLDATTGAIAAGWHAPSIDAKITRLVLADNMLWVGGYFSKIDADPRGGLAVLNPTTGADLTGFATPSFTGHHNFNVKCIPGAHTTCANGAIGIKSFDINPAGTQLVAVGNFTSVGGTSRDQVALLDIGATAATVDLDWNTLAYTAACASNSFDSYVRDVQFSPDGTYFVIVATGASGTNSDGTKSSCDATGRYESNGVGANVRPTWIDYTGRDSLWTVAVTGAAVYIGGHQRWLNNSNGSDRATGGAVPRPGIAAMDPVNGMPLSWNPGRNPRGKGAYALLATADGLYVGSDTDWIGNTVYHHKKIAYFPLAGGATLAPTTTGSLPGNVYLTGGSGGSATVRAVRWDGSGTPSTPTSVGGAENFTSVRGVFEIGNTIYYGSTDGNFYQRHYDGRTFGAPTAIDPYDDPVWSTVATGSGQTYRGLKPTFYSELSSLTSMFYWNGRVYYTLSGRSGMFWRWFEPDSGVMGADEFTVSDGLNWSHTAGAFLDGSTLYFADSSSHNLFKIPFVNGQATGTSTLANSDINWASNGAFVLSGSMINDTPPTAAFTTNCTSDTRICTVNAGGSNDPDGTITDYSWAWGDSTTSSDVDGHDQHAYAADGAYPITLTVTDNDGVTSQVTHTVYIGVSPPPPIAFAGVSAKHGNATSETVSIPATTATNDGLLLFETFASNTVTDTVPAGWTLVGSTVQGSHTTRVFSRVAAASDAGSNVTVTYSATIKASLTIADYTGTDTTNPVETFATTTATNTKTAIAPILTGLSDGSYVVSFWTDKSSATTSFTPPPTVTQRSVTLGAGSAAVNALLADSDRPISGNYAAKLATTNDQSPANSGWSIALKLAST
ncbi:MAG: PKD domain-containing protein [Frankiaceae bacterium]|nr:PKD domain-containing protein [Frankiaceae bacterium]